MRPYNGAPLRRVGCVCDEIDGPPGSADVRVRETPQRVCRAHPPALFLRALRPARAGMAAAVQNAGIASAMP
ncbi:hypothetical protein HRbin30_02858 [bacterium HR30]|nr:hypothetical protein HRbin30_02858 [bacterium HR30]